MRLQRNSCLVLNKLQRNNEEGTCLLDAIHDTRSMNQDITGSPSGFKLLKNLFLLKFLVLFFFFFSSLLNFVFFVYCCPICNICVASFNIVVAPFCAVWRYYCAIGSISSIQHVEELRHKKYFNQKE